MTIDTKSNSTKIVRIGYNPERMGSGYINGFACIKDNIKTVPTTYIDCKFDTQNDIKKTIEDFIKKGFALENISLNGQPVTDMFGENQNCKKTFIVTIKDGISKRKLFGDTNGVNFFIIHHENFIKKDSIAGNINGKDLNLNIKKRLFSPNIIKGTLGKDTIYLKVKNNIFTGTKIYGNFKDKPISVTINKQSFQTAIKSDNIDMKFDAKLFQNNNMKLSGKYNEDKDFLPILADIIYNYQNY